MPSPDPNPNAFIPKARPQPWSPPSKNRASSLDSIPEEVEEELHELASPSSDFRQGKRRSLDLINPSAPGHRLVTKYEAYSTDTDDAQRRALRQARFQKFFFLHQAHQDQGVRPQLTKVSARTVKERECQEELAGRNRDVAAEKMKEMHSRRNGSGEQMSSESELRRSYRSCHRRSSRTGKRTLKRWS